MNARNKEHKTPLHLAGAPSTLTQRDLFIDNLLVRVHFIIEMIWWTGLAPWEFEVPFPGSLISTFLVPLQASPVTDCLYVDVLGARHESVNFGARIARAFLWCCQCLGTAQVG